MPLSCTIQKDIGHSIYADYYNRIRKKYVQDERRGMFIFQGGGEKEGETDIDICFHQLDTILGIIYSIKNNVLPFLGHGEL